MPTWPRRRQVSAAAAGHRGNTPSELLQVPPPQIRSSLSASGDAMGEMLGPVTETKDDHLARHGGGLRSCPRCRYYKRSAQWSRQVAETTRAGPRNLVWLAERPVRWGGTWGLGCKICADSVARVAVDGAGTCRTAGAQRRRLGTAWARFEVRAKSLQAEHIRQHQDYDVHRVAVLSYLRPDAPVALALQADLSDDRLLAGSVPQPCDWLRAWRAARTPQSWRAASETLQTEHFIRQCRDRSVLTRPLEQMAEIMQEVIRLDKREMLRQSKAISLSFDDRKGYKLVRYRAALGRIGDSAPAAPQGAAEAKEAVACEGILGCIQCLRGSTLEDLADDYAARAAREVVALISRFCTPLGDVQDDNLFSHIVKTVRSICCDGALQKVAAVLRSTFTEVVLIQRDPAHFIRIACMEPLVRTGRFEAQHKRLFTAKHALLKSVQFSDALQARLEACQRIVVQSRGCQGGDVRHIMRHFSFAAHRFESWAGPRRKYACCVHAVALLLCEMAGDSRRSLHERQEAQAALDAMTPRDMLEVGLAADFGEICMRCSADICVCSHILCLAFDSRLVPEAIASYQLAHTRMGELV